MSIHSALLFGALLINCGRSVDLRLLSLCLLYSESHLHPFKVLDFLLSLSGFATHLHDSQDDHAEWVKEMYLMKVGDQERKA